MLYDPKHVNSLLLSNFYQAFRCDWVTNWYIPREIDFIPIWNMSSLCSCSCVRNVVISYGMTNNRFKISSFLFLLFVCSLLLFGILLYSWSFLDQIYSILYWCSCYFVSFVNKLLNTIGIFIFIIYLVMTWP